MNLMTAGILSIALITIIVTTTTAAIRADARSSWENQTLRVSQARTPTQLRRPATRVAGIRRPAGRASPQYLPALERARILRAHTSHLAIRAPRRRPAPATAVPAAIPVSGSSGGEQGTDS